jgi:ABC-type amino acid transport/signal transduction systems, periplasmic component/domain
MGILDRRSVLTCASRSWLGCAAVFLLLLPGCGLLIDAVEQAWPVTGNEVDAICSRARVQVGLAMEPFRPFVFPTIWTDEGARVTGLDVELVRAMTDGLSQRCGQPVTPVLHLVRFRDLFRLLNEGHLDWFVSAVATNIPAPNRAGVAYSIPYFYGGGSGGITRNREVLDRVQANLREQARRSYPDRLTATRHALDGLTIAVQDDTSAHHYAEANLSANWLIVCDSLPAAFEYADSQADPPIDVILGAQPVLEYMVTRVRKDWSLLTRENGTPLFVTKGHYAVVMAEESYRLRWLVNDLLLQLDESGRLHAMRKRWTEDEYAFPRRASLEGLPFDVEKMAAHYTQGTCRIRPGA